MRTFLLSRAASASAGLAVLLLAGCSRSNNQVVNPPAPQPQAQNTAPAQPVAAKDAFWPMYKAAHEWASDVMVLRLTAKPVAGFKIADGKAPMWEAVFASSSHAKYRVFTYSITDVPPSIYKGLNGGMELNWPGVTRDVMPVDMSQFNVDSDAAYQAAAADAAAWLRNNPNKELASLQMGDSYQFPVPVWYVMWGTKTAGYAAFVDASNGRVLKHK
jgi:hypothetical protein